MGISGSTYNRLRDLLLRCGPFDSGRSLRAVFIDSRLAPWRRQVPDGGSAGERAEFAIDFLYDKENVRGENALVLLLQVLADRTSSADACKRELETMAKELMQRKGEPEMPGSAMPSYQQQRLQDLKQNIQADLKLLRRYEEKLRLTDDPREEMRIEGEIARQKESLAGYRQEMAALEAGVEPGAEPSKRDGGTQTEMGEVRESLDTLSQQISGMEARLVAEHETTRRELAAHREAILAHIDSRHQETVGALLQRMDENQLKVVEMLMEAADKQELARWESQQLTLLVQQALVDLKRVREGQPEAAQWQSLLEILERDTSVQQKLKLTIPIVPTVLEFESELSVDVKDALKQAWQRLARKVKR